MSQLTLADQIRSCEYLYLGVLREPNVNQLKIVLVEGMVGAPLSDDEVVETDPVIRSLLVGAKRIARSPESRRFELTWNSYIGYSIVNESYSNGEPHTSTALCRIFQLTIS